MIKIQSQNNNKEWIVTLECEVWKFNSLKEMEAGLKTLLDLKEKKGNLK